MAKDIASAALLKPNASRGRNQFPLDHKHVYSIKSGQITPVKALHFIPDDYFDIQAHDFSLTFPMNTAAFLRGRKETSFYSVYYSAVWSLFNQYMAQRVDNKTSAFTQTPRLSEPRISLFHLYLACYQQFGGYLFYKYYLPAYVQSQSLMTDNVKSQFLKVIQEDWLGSNIEYSSPWKLYFKKTYTGQLDISPNIEFELPHNLPAFEVGFTGFGYIDTIDDDPTYGEVYQDIVGHFRAYSYIRKLDMLGYGNLYPLFKTCEKQIASAVSLNPDNVANIITLYCSSLYAHICGLSATFDGIISSPDITPIFTYINVYAICAYNSVFYHFFRNSYYDTNYNCHDYSLDFISTDGGRLNNTLGMRDFTLRFLDIEYHQWKKDIFTSVLPDTQFGAVSSLSFTGTLQSDIPTSGVYTAQVDNNKLLRVGGSASQGLYYTNWTMDNAFDVIALKRAEMLQDYRQTLMRAGNKTSNIFKALYGGAPSSEHEDDVIPRFLETFGEDIFVDPVESTAATGEQVNGHLGDLSARGKFKGDSKHIKFNAGYNYGVILCLTYVVPEAEYNSYMLDKHNLELSPEAHFLPAYENFGLEPVYSDELNSLVPRNDIKVLGYAPRYYHKKMALDMVHGAFVSLPAHFLQPLTFDPRTSTYDPLYFDDFFGDFNHWVSPRTDMQGREITRLRDFYINPSVLDNVFVRAVSSDIADDQFICNTYFDIQSTRGMSKIGLIDFV